MINKSRSKAVVINSTISMFTVILRIILAFVVRKIFINILGITYLGYFSVFSNILQFLNLAELGIGVAITSFLYAPLTNNDMTKVNALMSIFKQLYLKIALFVFIAGMFLSLFLDEIIHDYSCSYFSLRIYYFLFLLSSVSSYFVAYKRVLLIADQKSYYINLIDTLLFFVASFAQIACLICYSSFSLYLVILILKNLISNIILSYKVDSSYQLKKIRVDLTLKSRYIKSIRKFVKDVFISRIGAAVFYGSDSIVLSIFMGVATVGYYSNYALLITQANAIISQVMSSIQSTYANYIYSESSLEKQKKILNSYFLVNYIIANFCFIVFIHTIQPFVDCVFGKDMLLDYDTVILLGITLYFFILLQLPSQIFTIFKLFNKDKFIILTSMSINVVLSVLLVKLVGINGVIWGTIVASLFYILFRYYFIYKIVFISTSSFFYKKLIICFLLSSMCLLFSYILTNSFKGNCSIFYLVIALFQGALFSVVLPLAFFCKTEEFEFVVCKFSKINPQLIKLLIYIILFSQVIIVSLIYVYHFINT